MHILTSILSFDIHLCDTVPFEGNFWGHLRSCFISYQITYLLSYSTLLFSFSVVFQLFTSIQLRFLWTFFVLVFKYIKDQTEHFNFYHLWSSRSLVFFSILTNPAPYEPVCSFYYIRWFWNLGTEFKYCTFDFFISQCLGK